MCPSYWHIDIEILLQMLVVWFCFLSWRCSFRYVWNMSQIRAIFDTFMKIGKMEKPVIPGL